MISAVKWRGRIIIMSDAARIRESRQRGYAFTASEAENAARFASYNNSGEFLIAERNSSCSSRD